MSGNTDRTEFLNRMDAVKEKLLSGIEYWRETADWSENKDIDGDFAVEQLFLVWIWMYERIMEIGKRG
mgnify:CR=1 FL=1